MNVCNEAEDLEIGWCKQHCYYLICHLSWLTLSCVSSQVVAPLPVAHCPMTSKTKLNYRFCALKTPQKKTYMRLIMDLKITSVRVEGRKISTGENNIVHIHNFASSMMSEEFKVLYNIHCYSIKTAKKFKTKTVLETQTIRFFFKIFSKQSLTKSIHHRPCSEKTSLSRLDMLNRFFCFTFLFALIYFLGREPRSNNQFVFP